MTVDNAYGMADLTELLERAAKAKCISTIDLASAYWQVTMSPESKLLTSFRTRRSLFQCNVIPQGLKNIRNIRMHVDERNSTKSSMFLNFNF